MSSYYISFREFSRVYTIWKPNKKIAIFIFDNPTLRGAVKVKSYFTRTTFYTNEVIPEAGKYMQDVLAAYLRGDEKYTVIAFKKMCYNYNPKTEEIIRNYEVVVVDECLIPEEITPSIAKEKGEKLKVDAILVGKVRIMVEKAKQNSQYVMEYNIGEIPCKLISTTTGEVLYEKERGLQPYDIAIIGTSKT